MRSARPLLFLTIVVLTLGLSGSNPTASAYQPASRLAHTISSNRVPGTISRAPTG